MSDNTYTDSLFESGFIDTDFNYKQSSYSKLIDKRASYAKIRSWRNDVALLRLAIFSKEIALRDIEIKCSDLINAENVIEKDKVKISVIKETSAFTGGKGYGEGLNDRREKVFDIVTEESTLSLEEKSFGLILVEINVEDKVKFGTYSGFIEVSVEEGKWDIQKLDIQLFVDEKILIKDNSNFDIELWQYPYSSAEYFGYEPFSKDHLEVMKSGMKIYQDMGGNNITATIVEEAWGGQTYSVNKIAYPSMVKWIRENDTLRFDYTDLDKWIEFNMGMGMPNKIALYSISPWNSSIGIHENGEVIFRKFDLRDSGDSVIWIDFLSRLAKHLEERGWLDICYIAIDEQGFSEEAFDIIESIKTKNGNGFKISAAMDHFAEKMDLAMRVDDLTVGAITATKNEKEFSQLLALRDDKKLKTTIYSCTGHAPGQFMLSQPVESYWILMDSWRRGAQGFLRWAYDAWINNPLEDTSHKMFEPGDCFLVYPIVSKKRKRYIRSFRLVRIAEAIRDIHKAILLEGQIRNGLNQGRKMITRSNEKSTYLNICEISQVIEDVEVFKESIK